MNKINIEKYTDHLLQAAEVEQITNFHRVTLLRRASRRIAHKPQKVGGRWYWRNSDMQAFISGKWEKW